MNRMCFHTFFIKFRLSRRDIEFMKALLEDIFNKTLASLHIHTEYSSPPIAGPTDIPRPTNVSRIPRTEPIESGKAFTTNTQLAVEYALAPRASIPLTTKHRTVKVVVFSTNTRVLEIRKQLTNVLNDYMSNYATIHYNFYATTSQGGWYLSVCMYSYVCQTT